VVSHREGKGKKEKKEIPWCNSHYDLLPPGGRGLYRGKGDSPKFARTREEKRRTPILGVDRKGRPRVWY